MITFKTTKAVSPQAIQALFRHNEWWDWWSLGDIKWYLSRALFIVSAWHGRKLVGIGTLTGDGRIAVNLDALLVDGEYQDKGIGTTLVKRLVAKAECMHPYYFQTDVYEQATERLYRRFGFRKNKGTWLLSHHPTGQRWAPQAMADRKERRKMTANKTSHAIAAKRDSA